MNTSFPYDVLGYHIDLSMLAYKLHGQALIWPLDPYYEDNSGGWYSNESDKKLWSKQERKEIIEKVWTWTHQLHQNEKPPIERFTGPGLLKGFPANKRLDPILFCYSSINPWKNCFYHENPNSNYVVYQTPEEITDKIVETHMCFFPDSSQKPIIDLIKRNNRSKGQDILLCFEGGTGDKEGVTKCVWSPMGFVLLRMKERGAYDVHIIFRGSRSGALLRTIFESHWDQATGNPDWVTDLGYNKIYNPDICGENKSFLVHRGFTQSLLSMKPTIFSCLEWVNNYSKKQPDNIYVSGHSLGGGLAQIFSSMVLMGNKYGPKGKGEEMPKVLKLWPWENLKLITNSAPRVGNQKWAKFLTEDLLNSDFFDVNTYDPKAIRPSEPNISKILQDKNRPAAFRVLLQYDPITTEKIIGGKHVGKTVYTDASKNWYNYRLDSAHEITNLRSELEKHFPKKDAFPKKSCFYLSKNDAKAYLTRNALSLHEPINKYKELYRHIRNE